MDPIEVIGAAALAVLVAGWLVVSFSAPGPRRTLVEWISAAALYLSLCMLFLHLSLRARAEGGALAMWAFGFLCALFAAGTAVSLFNAVRSGRGGRKDQLGATH